MMCVEDGNDYGYVDLHVFVIVVLINSSAI